MSLLSLRPASMRVTRSGRAQSVPGPRTAAGRCSSGLPREKRVSAVDDLALLERVANKDQAAFRYLVERYKDQVLGVCFRVLGDRQEAEDVAQDVFIVVYQKAAKFRGEALLSTWLFRIARNQSLNRVKYLERRGRRKKQALEDVSEGRLAELQGPVADPETKLEAQERNQRVQQAITELKPTHRVVIVLRDIEGLSYDQISSITGLRVGTVKSRVHRARTALAAKLEGIL